MRKGPIRARQLRERACLRWRTRARSSDELGEMPLHLQGKLLSVIEDRKVRRLGGEIERPIDVRITASTNVDIEKAVGSTVPQRFSSTTA